MDVGVEGNTLSRKLATIAGKPPKTKPNSPSHSPKCLRWKFVLTGRNPRIHKGVLDVFILEGCTECNRFKSVYGSEILSHEKTKKIELSFYTRSLLRLMKNKHSKVILFVVTRH